MPGRLVGQDVMAQRSEGMGKGERLAFVGRWEREVGREERRRMAVGQIVGGTIVLERATFGFLVRSTKRVRYLDDVDNFQILIQYICE